MKYYETIMLKKDGTSRTIKFIYVEEFQNLTLKEKQFLNLKDLKDTTARNLQEGSKLVFDIEAKGFRVVNFNSLLSEIQELEVKYE